MLDVEMSAMYKFADLLGESIGHTVRGVKQESTKYLYTRRLPPRS